MKDFKGKVAVVTGAASGIGEHLLKSVCMKGANRLADVEEQALKQAEDELKAQ